MKFVRFIETMQAWGFDVYQVSFPLKNTDFFPVQEFCDRLRPQLLPMDKGVLDINYVDSANKTNFFFDRQRFN